MKFTTEGEKSKIEIFNFNLYLPSKAEIRRNLLLIGTLLLMTLKLGSSSIDAFPSKPSTPNIQPRVLPIKKAPPLGLIPPPLSGREIIRSLDIKEVGMESEIYTEDAKEIIRRFGDSIVEVNFINYKTEKFNSLCTGFLIAPDLVFSCGHGTQEDIPRKTNKVNRPAFDLLYVKQLNKNPEKRYGVMIASQYSYDGDFSIIKLTEPIFLPKANTSYVSLDNYKIANELDQLKRNGTVNNSWINLVNSRFFDTEFDGVFPPINGIETYSIGLDILLARKTGEMKIIPTRFDSLDYADENTIIISTNDTRRRDKLYPGKSGSIVIAKLNGQFVPIGLTRTANLSPTNGRVFLSELQRLDTIFTLLHNNDIELDTADKTNLTIREKLSIHKSFYLNTPNSLLGDRTLEIFTNPNLSRGIGSLIIRSEEKSKEEYLLKTDVLEELNNQIRKNEPEKMTIKSGEDTFNFYLYRFDFKGKKIEARINTNYYPYTSNLN